MAEEEQYLVHLRDDFYRDSFAKVLFIILLVGIAIVLITGLSIYLHFDKPPPETFPVSAGMRVQPLVPLNKPYLSTPDVLQWVANALPKSFHIDFNHYNDQLRTISQSFTADGWKIFLNQLNIYANYNNVQTYKLFVYGSPASSPFILKEGLLSGRYAWWVQMQVNITYAGYNQPLTKSVIYQVLVVRVPTLNNLDGVGIDNVMVAPTK